MATNVPQPQQSQAMETNDDARAFQALVLSFNWISEPDLCSVSTLNSHFLTAARENHLWQPILSKLQQMPLHDFVEVSASDFPTESDVATMLIPPRIHGERRDDRWTPTLLPHSRDRVARRHPKGPLVLQSGRTSMKMENGKLYDVFYRTQDDDKNSWEKEEVWLERSFPIECEACLGITLNDEREVLQHCAQYNHIANAKCEWNKIQHQFADPRHDPEYEVLDAFHKAQALSEYRSMVIEYLRSPMNNAARANMEGLVESVKSTVTWLYDLSRDHFAMDEQTLNEFEQDYETALFYCTLERTIHVCVEAFAIKSFVERGLEGYFCDDVIRHGWESFQLSEMEDQVHLASLVSGSYLVDSADFLGENYGGMLG